MKSVLTVENVIKRYKHSDKNALNCLNLIVNEGDIYGFLGPNGAGKSTTIKILSGLISYDEGCINIMGKNIKEHREQLKKSIGIVPQDIAVFPSLTAYENLRIFGSIYGIEKKALKERIDCLLTMFGLDDNKKRKIEHYSGGMKRRINLIIGILHKPSFLLLDEPTVGIDVQSKSLIIENLRKLNQEGTTILYTSHDMNEAQNFCTKVGIIDEGAIIAEGSPLDLITRSTAYSNLESVYLHLIGKSLRA